MSIVCFGKIIKILSMLNMTHKHLFNFRLFSYYLVNLGRLEFVSMIGDQMIRSGIDYRRTLALTYGYLYKNSIQQVSAGFKLFLKKNIRNKFSLQNITSCSTGNIQNISSRFIKMEPTTKVFCLNHSRICTRNA